MRWYELRSQHLSDEEYIEQVRKNLQFMDRYRFWIIAGYVAVIVAMLLVVLPLVEKSIRLIVELQSPFGGAAWPVFSGFVSGVGLGFGVMCLFSMPLLSLILTLMPLRTDRLLLRHYDAHQSIDASRSTGIANGKRLPSTAS
jgi:hypothetical protein